MKERHTLHEIYADLLTEQADPESVQLIQDLDSIGNAPYPPVNVNWANIRALHAEQTVQKKRAILPELSLVPGRSFGYSHQPPLRKAILAPVMIGLVLIIAAAFAPLLRSVQSIQSPPLVRQANGSLFTSIHQSRSIADAVVTLVNGYADVNQIILGYTLSSSKTFVVSQSDLRTQEGFELSTQGINEALHAKDMLATSLFFSSRNITWHPQTLDLRLWMQIARIAPAQTPTKQSKLQNLGTVEFNFMLPFYDGRAAAPHESAASNGKTLTLDRVVVGQLATRVDVLGLEPIKLKVPLEVALQPPGDAPPGFMPTKEEVNSPGTSTFIYPYNFFQKQGTWILTIQQGTYNWTFHFVVPAAS